MRNGGIWITMGQRESVEEEGYGSPWDRGKVRKRKDIEPSWVAYWGPDPSRLNPYLDR